MPPIHPFQQERNNSILARTTVTHGGGGAQQCTLALKCGKGGVLDFDVTPDGSKGVSGSIDKLAFIL